MKDGSIHVCALKPTKVEAAKIHDRVRRVKEYHPEYTHKQLAMVCCCGEGVVERALSRTN